MATSVGEIEATLRLRDELTAQLRTSLSQLGRFGDQIKRVGAVVSEAGSALTLGFTVPLTAAATAGLKFANSFQTSMTRVHTIAGEAAVNIKGLSEQVLQLARVTGIGPQRLAEALVVIESTGIRGAKAMSILTESAKASATGLGDITDIARSLTSAMTAYAASGLTAADASNKLFVAVREGGAEASEFAGTLGRVVGIAATMGVSFDEVTAQVATFTRLGVDADEAVTALRGTLNNFLHPAKQVRDVLASLGETSVSVRESIRERGLAATLTDLVTRLKGNQDAIGTLIPNVRALAGVLGTAGTQSGAYAEILRKIQAAVGDLDAAFKVTSETAGFKWNVFLAEAQILAIRFGDTLQPVFMKVLEVGERMLDWAEEAVAWFGRLPDPVQKAAIAFGLVAAAIGPVLAYIGLVARGLGGIIITIDLATAAWIRYTAAAKTATTATAVAELVAVAPAATAAGRALKFAAGEQLAFNFPLIQGRNALGQFIPRLHQAEQQLLPLSGALEQTAVQAAGATTWLGRLSGLLGPIGIAVGAIATGIALTAAATGSWGEALALWLVPGYAVARALEEIGKFLGINITLFTDMYRILRGSIILGFAQLQRAVDIAVKALEALPGVISSIAQAIAQKLGVSVGLLIRILMVLLPDSIKFALLAAATLATGFKDFQDHVHEIADQIDNLARRASQSGSTAAGAATDWDKFWQSVTGAPKGPLATPGIPGTPFFTPPLSGPRAPGPAKPGAEDGSFEKLTGDAKKFAEALKDLKKQLSGAEIAEEIRKWQIAIRDTGISLEQLSVGPFRDEFKSFLDDVIAQMGSLDTLGIAGINKVFAEMELGIGDATREADKFMKVLGAGGDIQRMSREQLEKYIKVVEEAIDEQVRMGKEVPDSYREVYLALVKQSDGYKKAGMAADAATNLTEIYGKRTEVELDRANDAMNEHLGKVHELSKELTDVTLSNEQDSLKKRLDMIRLEFDRRRQAVRGDAESRKQQIAILNQIEVEAIRGATRAWDAHIAEIQADLPTLRNILANTLSPSVLLQAVRTESLGDAFRVLGQAAADQFAQAFQKRVIEALAKGKQISTGTKALGVGAIGLDSLLQGFSFGEVLGKGKGALLGAGSGALTGAAIGSIVPGIGTAIGAAVGGITGLIGGLFGGGKKAKEEAKDLAEARKELLKQFGGFDNLKKTADELGVSLGNAFNTKKPEEFRQVVERLNDALERQKSVIEGINTMATGTNARADVFIAPFRAAREELEKLASQFEENELKLAKVLLKKPAKNDQEAAKFGLDLKSQIADQMRFTKEIEANISEIQQRVTALREKLQPEFEAIGIFTASTFGAMIRNGSSAAEAIMALKPSFDALREGVDDFGLTSTPIIDELLRMFNVVDSNKGAFEALAADGQILAGAIQSGTLGIQLFNAIAGDMNAQIQKVIDNGTPMEEALALAQPQLQALWEAQEKFGFKTDEATQALIDQAKEAGIVGPQFRDINQKILDVLLAIGKVLGADIPDALKKLPSAAERARDGIEDAFAGTQIDIPVNFDVQDPRIQTGGGFVDSSGEFHPPELAQGGIVTRKTLAWIGEKGPEAVVPVEDLRSMRPQIEALGAVAFPPLELPEMPDFPFRLEPPNFRGGSPEEVEQANRELEEWRKSEEAAMLAAAEAAAKAADQFAALPVIAADAAEGVKAAFADMAMLGGALGGGTVEAQEATVGIRPGDVRTPGGGGSTGGGTVGDIIMQGSLVITPEQAQAAIDQMMEMTGGRNTGIFGGVLADIAAGRNPFPQLAKGGIIPPRPGGTLVNVGEAGMAEAVVPLTPEMRTMMTTATRALPALPIGAEKPDVGNVVDVIKEVPQLAKGGIVPAGTQEAVQPLPARAREALGRVLGSDPDRDEKSLLGPLEPILRGAKDKADPARLALAAVQDMATGGIVRPKPGGTLVNVAEAGRSEAIIPLPPGFNMRTIPPFGTPQRTEGHPGQQVPGGGGTFKVPMPVPIPVPDKNVPEGFAVAVDGAVAAIASLRTASELAAASFTSSAQALASWATNLPAPPTAPAPPTPGTGDVPPLPYFDPEQWKTVIDMGQQWAEEDEAMGEDGWRDAPLPMKVPRAAAGALVRPTPGGSLINVGEGGHSEAIIPLPNTFDDLAGQTSVTFEKGAITVYGDATEGFADRLIDRIETSAALRERLSRLPRKN